jgi:hypothetical protein
MWKELCVALGVVGATGLASCVVAPVPEHRSYQPAPRAYDQDRDGISDRHDRDRDGDGVSNRRDRRPDNPRRY